MIEQLFGSKTRVKLLQLFMSNPNRSFYVREMTRKIDEQINSVRRELANLLSIGVITSDTNDNRLYYEVNQKFIHYEPLVMMFGGEASSAPKSTKDSDSEPVSAEQPILEILKKAGHLDAAILTGQFTRDELSGIDLLIVGNYPPAKIDKAMADIERKEGKELRYVLMSLSDFQYRRQINDRFILLLMDAKKQILFDAENIFGQ